MNARLTFEALLAASALLVAGTAWADGECSKGYRQVTPAERSTMTHVLETARGALPAAPAGWAVISDDRISVPASYCRD